MIPAKNSPLLFSHSQYCQLGQNNQNSVLHSFVPLSIVLAHLRQRTNLAAWYARDANLAPVADEVNVEGIIAVRGNELTKNLVGFFIRRFFGDPAEAFRDAKDVGIYWECGQSRTTVYGSWLSYLRVWNDR